MRALQTRRDDAERQPGYGHPLVGRRHDQRVRLAAALPAADRRAEGLRGAQHHVLNGDAVEGGQVDVESVLAAEMGERAESPNISYLAFTATPKNKTLELFGRKGVDGKAVEFHLYSMKQAIEEGYSLDVLKGYQSYDTALKIALAYWNVSGKGSKTRLIGRERGYHGVGFGGISVGGGVIW